VSVWDSEKGITAGKGVLGKWKKRVVRSGSSSERAKIRDKTGKEKNSSSLVTSTTVEETEDSFRGSSLLEAAKKEHSLDGE